GLHTDGHRNFGRHERKTAVVQDVPRIEQDDAVEAGLTSMLGELLGPLPVFGFLDLHAARSFSRQSGSSSRNRLTRSPTGGCVTNRAASPTSMNGLIVYSGSVAGLPWKETSSEAWSSRMSASAIGCGESQIAAAVASARNSRFGDSIRWTNADASGPRKNNSTRDSQPPIRLSSSNVAASTTTEVCTTTSRCRTCASS